jgi:hypothetical protein
MLSGLTSSPSHHVIKQWEPNGKIRFAASPPLPYYGKTCRHKMVFCFAGGFTLRLGSDSRSLCYIVTLRRRRIKLKQISLYSQITVSRFCSARKSFLCARILSYRWKSKQGSWSITACLMLRRSLCTFQILKFLENVITLIWWWNLVVYNNE